MPRYIPDRERYARALASANRAVKSLRRALKLLSPDGGEIEWAGRVRDTLEDAEGVADGLRRNVDRYGAPRV